MVRKSVGEGSRRDDIVSAALELFFTQGYDGTSVRAIMTKAGGEVGLFYYYFKNKDDVFDSVLDRFFSHYDADFVRMIQHGRRNPCRVMQDFFEYMEAETTKFRVQYAEKMHRTVRWAIREHTLTLIEPYLEQVVQIQSSYYGVKPALEPRVAALFLTHGVGSYILHEDQLHFQMHRAEVKRSTSLIMSMPMEKQELRTPYPASREDIPAWMALMGRAGRNADLMDEAAYKARLAQRIDQGEGWVFRYGDGLAAALLYTQADQTVDLLVVSPEFADEGLTERLLETAAAQFPVGATLTLKTFNPPISVTLTDEPLRLRQDTNNTE